ncbi:KH domain-containing protein [Anaerolineales bacterium HSG6]|nr:KH domain-containing protein [Anaerolineales bacterium HSG6]MDM8529814.1 KH domain-containing protein [Anaerolineales bacterium HSG25]
MGYLKDLTQNMARAVVSEPDEVKVEEVEGSSMVVIELSVASIDMGRIIGKEGRVANAMRTLLRTSAAKDGKRVSLEII